MQVRLAISYFSVGYDVLNDCEDLNIHKWLVSKMEYELQHMISNNLAF